jgi:hypothetical protein
VTDVWCFDWDHDPDRWRIVLILLAHWLLP